MDVMPIGLTDEELVKQCIAGRQEAFSELVDRYKKLIYSVVYHMLRDKQEVNDVSQEVFLRIYKSIDRYNPEFKFSTWAAKIASNLCLDILRRHRTDTVPIEQIENMSRGANTPEDSYIRKERSARIREAIDSLPEKYRLPVVLFHQNGLSYEEITVILQEPMTIVKNRLYRARLMLREKLFPDKKEESL